MVYRVPRGTHFINTVLKARKTKRSSLLASTCVIASDIGKRRLSQIPTCESRLESSTKTKVYSTWYCQAVTHPSTNQAQHCLASVIERELAFSTRFGRRQTVTQIHTILDKKYTHMCNNRDEKTMECHYIALNL